MKNYTIKDIAKRAGVGTTTVSRVLNNHPYVSEEKRDKVLQAIEDLNYRPNKNAKWLRESSSGIVGFLTDEVATTPFAVDIIRGAQEAASERDYVLMVMNTGKDMQDAEAAVEFLLERQVAGIVYAAMFHQEVQLPDNIYQTPTALANCFVDDDSLPAAVPDEFVGGYRATKRLLKAGHRRIALLNVFPDTIPAAVGRLAGYKAALAEHDIAFDATLIDTGWDTSQEVFTTTQQMLQMSNRPTGFFAGNDRIAMGIFVAIKDMGLRIPEDVGVVGFDNQESVARYLIPALTTIQLPHYEMGRWAFDRLFAEDDDPIREKIDCALVERKSV